MKRCVLAKDADIERHGGELCMVEPTVTKEGMISASWNGGRYLSQEICVSVTPRASTGVPAP